MVTPMQPPQLPSPLTWSDKLFHHFQACSFVILFRPELTIDLSFFQRVRDLQNQGFTVETSPELAQLTQFINLVASSSTF